MWKRKSTIVLAVGGIVLLAGAVLSLMHIEPWADYVLVAGAALVIIRGFIRERERDTDEQQPTEE